MLCVARGIRPAPNTNTRISVTLKNALSLLAVLWLAACASTVAARDDNTDTRPSGATQLHDGFFDLLWHEDAGTLWLAIERFDEPFIYQSALARGIGSNDIGLDRGQLGSTAVVSFMRVGPKVLLMEHNLRYRAPSANPFEQQAIEESFARSVLWGFEVVRDDGEKVWVDMTVFAQRDAHGLAARLRQQGHGHFSPDGARSAVYLPRTRAFPDNTEIEAVVTFTGEPDGRILPTVVPDPTAITVHLHHSFVRLPDDNFEPLPYDPRSGFIDVDIYGGFYNYAVPIGEPTARAHARRHRLHKKDPRAQVSEPLEPIVYFVDRGAPEPVRQALIDGASWWNDAFTAAGFRDAFVVKLLPEDADPLDVRYNVIQWVHRSTRGWSYGSSVVDPRTGEIIKGHVTLGSLRVRQDYLLAEGLLSPYDARDTSPQMLEMSLARIRQLSAHEVGHTIGLEHNFAGSADDRSSVMDYPFPLIKLTGDNQIDLSDAYAVGIGRWDTRAIVWGYGDYSQNADPAAAREKALLDTYASGLRFVADLHARDVGAMHPDGNLWDNGEDAVAQLEHLMRVRDVALANFSARTVRPGRSLATIEEAFVPIYLLHRYQIQAVGKLIGGARFTYALRGDGQSALTPVPAPQQRKALGALLGTLKPDALAVPAALVDLPPRPPGFAFTAARELFTRHTGDRFDELAPAAAFTQLCLDVLLNPQRAARLTRGTHNPHQSAPQDFEPSLDWRQLLGQLMATTWHAPRRAGVQGALQRTVTQSVALRLAALANDDGADRAVRAGALITLQDLMTKLAKGKFKTPSRQWAAHDRFVLAQLERELGDPATRTAAPSATPPPGSPIGGG